MYLTEDTPVATAALPVGAMTEHLRLGTGFSDDGMQDRLIETYVRAAIATLEGRIGKALLARRFRLTLGRWRGYGPQALPMAPVTKVLSVTVAGREVLDTRLRLLADMHRPMVDVRGGFPAIPAGEQAEIVFEAGFGEWSDVPHDLQQAVMLLAAEYYEARTEVGSRPSALPMHVAALIDRWRLMRVMGGAACV
ncbi:head-tail connector protein [Falsirhodobacter halotolerans]|uniref:head-tail connector protein n=1 Tax=Falsirhodobacter halotolerans TaxID=1146892 RepID=UPI001FCFFA41|nr:hypothetical protein [Falsirhodobacter halotolerans]MCJ8139298.1 hypothetical protein [Falsirhodobacter halotolerans]